ncbi:MAG: YopX family protein [Blautia sp.]|nr:YopX family protein [Blautia sp.]
MNDRYLFRAKRTDNGEWVEGFLFQLCYDSTFCWCIGNEPLTPNDYSELYGFNREWFYIDESTICQCTGLKDKNEKMIWENDICDRKEPYPEIVTYAKGDWTLDYSYATGRERGSCYCNLGFYTNERMSVSVIGNIFDNPELLEQEG